MELFVRLFLVVFSFLAAVSFVLIFHVIAAWKEERDDHKKRLGQPFFILGL